MITRAITHQKHLVQSRRSARRALYMFNTLHVFTKKSQSENKNSSWSVWISIRVSISSDSDIRLECEIRYG